MKPFLALLVLCALTFSACMSTSDTTLRAGAAETVITPEVVLKSLEGIKWIGEVGGGRYVPKEGELMHVDDDLYARALVLADDRQRLAIVTVDILTFSDFAYIEVLLEAINKATGIPKENIAINTSQTHNAPYPGDTRWQKGWKGGSGVKSDPYFWSKDKQASTVDVDIPYDEWLDSAIELSPYYEWLAGHIAATVKIAADNLQPATLRVGRAPVQIGYNRRLMKDGEIIMAPNPKGVVVPWVDVLGAYGEDGKRIAGLFSHAAHPVIIHFLNCLSRVLTVISPDFPGYAIKHLRNLLSTEGGPEGVFMFAQGCGVGNINGFPHGGGFGAADAAGLSLAFAVTRALADGKNVTSAPLKARSMTLSLPLQDPPSVAECKELLAQEPDSRRLIELLKIAESGESQFLTFPMRALAVGDELCILALTGEMFAEYQLFVDETSPFKHTFVFSHTNGNAGYVATKKDYELGPAGGYESWSFPTGRPPWLPLRPSAEQLVQEGITRLLSELKLD